MSMLTKIESIPLEIKSVRQWVCWTMADKVPRNPNTGGNAKSNDPSTWGSFEEACSACAQYGFDGLGFMFANGYFGVDLDHCVDNIDFCDEFVSGLKSYSEYSRSGDGIHIICRGELPAGARRRGNVEMYSSGRYFICTGNIYNPNYQSIAECSGSIKALHEKYLSDPVKTTQNPVVESANLDDREIIEKASGCKTGSLFKMLYAGNWQGVYPTQSDADFALCGQLAFWTGKDSVQMDRIFRSSGLYRRKWDEQRGAMTYGELTISKACARCVDVYSPSKYSDDAKLAFTVFKGGNVGAQDVEKKRYDQTDTGNAHRLHDRFGEVLRYSYNRKRWYFWNGRMWELDDSGQVKKLADIVCDDMKKEAMREQDDKAQVEMLKWASRTASSRGKEAMIKECQHLPGIPVGVDDLDSYVDYINCRNGIVNLRNGELIPHDSAFMMSRIAYADYDTSGKKPELWLKFLNDVMGGDDSLIEYVQRCIGYSLTGTNAEQCAYFLYGIGNNGKTTFLDTISNVLGGYASNVQPETIMMRKFGDSSGGGSDIARLKGARFVTSEEPTEGMRLNEGLLKQLTGGGKVTCRFLYGDEFEYTPEFKIWMATNHKPVIKGTDLGIWRRIKLIPFEVTIPSSKVDKELPQKLKGEYSKILSWAVEGCLKWRQTGLAEPARVLEATKCYKQEMDILAGFIESCIEINYTVKEKLPARVLFEAYREWAKDNNEREMSSKAFHMEMGKRLPEKGRDVNGVFYKYVKLVEKSEDVSPGRDKVFKFEDFIG